MSWEPKTTYYDPKTVVDHRKFKGFTQTAFANWLAKEAKIVNKNFSLRTLRDIESGAPVRTVKAELFTGITGIPAVSKDEVVTDTINLEDDKGMALEFALHIIEKSKNFYMIGLAKQYIRRMYEN